MSKIYKMINKEMVVKNDVVNNAIMLLNKHEIKHKK